MNLLSIASGSSGNCIYVGSENTHLLVDTGISGKRIEAGLATLNLSSKDLHGILITHEHIDHVSGLGVILRRSHVPIYATAGTISSILNMKSLGKLDATCFQVIEPDHRFQIGDIEIEASSTWHDASDSVCYSFFQGDKKISIATDLGDFDEYIIDKLKGSNALLLESNHDIRMLESGSYPYSLKKRILGIRGHLSNERSGELIQAIYDSDISNILLGHLSKENNFPELAFETMRLALNECGADWNTLHLSVADRDACTKMITI